jgi:branched-chain amino acid aminotransferase
MEWCGKFFYLDGNIMPAGHDDEVVPGEVSFYEVIRVREGIPLFFDDHMKRMSAGISTRYELHEDLSERVREGLDALVRQESYPEINVRVTVTFPRQVCSLHISYIPSSYPDEAMIREGVSLILYHAERLNPGVKVLNKRLRLSVNEALGRRKAYEALLVNSDGFITEGSRSNVFFLTGKGTIHTAPDKMVLSGITRGYVTEIIRKEEFDLIYEAVREAEISRFRSVFITGTSPMVLPVQKIENQTYEVDNPIVERIRQLYTGMAGESIRRFKLNKSRD